MLSHSHQLYHPMVEMIADLKTKDMVYPLLYDCIYIPHTTFPSALYNIIKCTVTKYVAESTPVSTDIQSVI